MEFLLLFSVGVSLSSCLFCFKTAREHDRKIKTIHETLLAIFSNQKFTAELLKTYSVELKKLHDGLENHIGTELRSLVKKELRGDLN